LGTRPWLHRNDAVAIKHESDVSLTHMQPSALPGWCRVVDNQQQEVPTPIIDRHVGSDPALLLTAYSWGHPA
jgi:hypothetical protein